MADLKEVFVSKALFACLAVTTCLSPVSALAATIDQAGADQLRGTFERYIGTAPSGQTPYVSVAPDGTAYKVTIDSHGIITAIAATLKAPINADASPISFHAAPVDGGKWRIYDFSAMKGSFAIKDESTSITVDKVDFDGIYDPAIAAFETSKTSIPLMTVDQQTDNAMGSAITRDAVQTTTGTAAHDGTTDAAVDAKFGSYQQTITMASLAGPSANGDKQTDTVKISAASRAFQIDMKGVHTKDMLDIWALIMANKSSQADVADTAAFKTAFLKFLPVIDTMAVTDGFKGIAINTPYGQANIASSGAKFNLSTAAGANTAAFNINLDSVAVDSVLIPPGVGPLLPTKISFGADVKNFDLPAVFRKAVELDETKATNPISKDAYDEAMTAALVPTGAVLVTLPPSAISGKDYTIAWQGDVKTTLGKTPHATFHLDVKATGVDAIAKQVGQLKVPNAAEAMIGIYAAQALAKKEPDGSVSWAIDYADGGEVLVNGKPIGKK